MAVRKRTWTTASGDVKAAWILDYVDAAGKRRIRTFVRKKDADTAASQTAVDISKGVHTPRSQSPNVARAAELWLTTCENNGLERSTLEPYRRHVKLHLSPYIGNVKLVDLTSPIIRDLEDKLLKGEAAPGETQGRRRSSALVKKVIGTLGSIITDAQERGLTTHNVVRDLRSKRRPGKDRRAEQRAKGRLKIGTDIPSREEAKAIVAALHGRWRPIILTATFTGLRSSELRGLRWGDVNLAKGELYVRQRADEWGVIGPPKSAAGERTVPLLPMVANTLREWKLACPNGPLGLVFPNGAGNVESHANIVTRGFHPVQISAGVVNENGGARYTGLHALRHFYASWCLNRVADGGLGLPLKTLQGRMGHAAITMTGDVYGHLFATTDDTAEMAAAELAFLA